MNKIIGFIVVIFFLLSCAHMTQGPKIIVDADLLNVAYATYDNQCNQYNKQMLRVLEEINSFIDKWSPTLNELDKRVRNNEPLTDFERVRLQAFIEKYAE